jgi:type III secretion protein Q
MPDIDVLADCINANDAEPDPPPSVVSAMTPGASPASPVILTCTRVTPERANLSRMIGRGCHAALAQRNALCTFHLAERVEVDWSDSIMFDGPFGSIEFAQGGRLVRALTGIDISTELTADDERWEWFQEALMARLADTPFACAERVVRNGHDATEAPRAPYGQADDVSMLRFTLRTSGHSLAVHARANAAAWLDFLGRTSWHQERLPFSQFAGLTFETAIRVARHTMPRQALRGLAAGDIFVPEKSFFGIRGGGYVQLGPMRARVRYQEPDSFRIVEVEVKLDSPEMNESELVDDAGDSAAMEQLLPEGEADTAELDSVPVTLSFEIGKLRMPLGELRTLGLDTILTPDGSTSSIAIRCGGRLLGRGELVDVDGTLGVRILEWRPKC